MEQRDWQGVFPAIRTPFLESFDVDHARIAKHVAWLADNGCQAIVALGSLGEGSSLSADEKVSILRADALPLESVRLFELGRDGCMDEARALYEWFLPLLRLDTVTKFVQLIKLVQAEVGHGNAVVRPPRLELAGDEVAEALTLIRERLAVRPKLM